MGKIDEYLNKAKSLAEEAGEAAKTITGEAVSRAKDLSDEHSKVKELTQNAREQSVSFAMGVKEKAEGLFQDARAAKEIRHGISELAALPEFEGSILYSMELEAMTNDLNALVLIINDGRLDDASVVEEIKKVMGKVQPSTDPQAEETEEMRAIEKAKVIAYRACTGALGIWEIQTQNQPQPEQ